MKARSAAIQGVLAFAGLAVAYGTWRREPPQGGTDVVVLDVTRNQVQKIRYEESTRTAELERGNDSEVWIRVAERPPAPPVVPAVDGGVAPPPPTPIAAPERTLRGNESAGKLYERFAPLRASRALGTLAPEKLKELGLAETKRKLEVTAGGTKYAFKIGTPTSGLSTPYLQSETDGKVYLLGGTVLGELEAAQSRLVDRRFHEFKPNEVDAVTVKAGDKQRDFVFSAGEMGQNAKLTPKATPDKPDEFAKNWHDKIWRLIPVELLGKGEKPAAGEPQVLARIDYSAKGKPAGFVELAQAGSSDLFARSEYTAGWVKVHAGSEDIAAEAKKVAAGQ